MSDTKVAWSAHIYANSCNVYRDLLAADLDDLAATGRPCIIGEFGNQHTGNCDWGGCVDYARQTLQWTVIGWCWNGDGELDQGNFNMVSPAWKENPSATTFAKSANFDVIYNKL